MALSQVNFSLVTPYIDLDVRDFPLDFVGINMPASLNPNDAKVLRDGEFLAPTLAYKMVRGSAHSTKAGTSIATLVNRPSYILYAERGRTDIQGVGKVPVIYRGAFEADTKLFLNTNLDTDKLVGDTTAGTTKFLLGMPLVICTGACAYDTTRSDYSLVAGLLAGQAGFVVGYVTRRPESNGTRGLRFYGQAGGYGYQTAGAL